MSTRLFVMVSRKVQPRSYHSNGAACGLRREIPLSALDNPDAFVREIRASMGLCEIAVEEELARLAAAHPGPPTETLSSSIDGKDQLAPPAARPAARGVPNTQRFNTPPPIPPPGPAEAWDESEQPYGATSVEDEPDEDAPTDGRQLLGWARKQDRDMKGWIISLGYKRKFKGNVVDWTDAQVAAAYAAAKKELANPTPTKKR